MSKYNFALALGIILIIIDRLFKLLALKLPAEGLFYFHNLFGLKLYLNKGIAFGLPLPLVVSIITSSIIILVLIYLRLNNRYNAFALVLIIIGAGSNLLDKIKYDNIIDLFTIKHLTVFNLADIYIVIGLICLTLNHKHLNQS